MSRNDELVGVITPKMRRAAAEPPSAPPAPPHLALGYGPAGAIESSTASARIMTSVGLGAALAAVTGRTAVVAFDIATTPTRWLTLAGCAAGVGAVAGATLGRKANLGRRVTTTAAFISLVGAIAWIVLINTGDPEAVKALLLVAIATSVPHLFTAAADLMAMEPTAHPARATASVGAGVSAGAALATGVLFVDPTIPWATVAGIGGIIAAFGAYRRMRLPERIFGTSGSKAAPRNGTAPLPGTTASGALMGGSLGIVIGAGQQLGPFLDTFWQAGIRYQLLTLSLAGMVAVGVMLAVSWWHVDHHAPIRSAELDAARLAMIAGATLAMVSISQTLPGTVGGAALAIGVAAAAVVSSATASMPATLLSTVIVGSLTAVGWRDFVDATGSSRISLALAAVPAVVLGAAAVAAQRPAKKPAEVAATDPVTATATAPVAAAPPNLPIDLTETFARGTGAFVNPAMAPPRTPLLVASGIEFSYGSVQALFGVDLEVHDGQITAIVGANGAGKTTFLRTIAGLATPSAGTIRFGGHDIGRFSASDRVLLGINQIAAGGAVAEDLSVADNLAMFGHTLPSKDAKAGAQRVLEVFPQFRDRLGQRAASLSGGERQMLALSKSLVLRPTLLIVDELSLGLAPIVVSALIPVIRRLHAEGASVLLVEQSVNVALELADQASCMEKGRIVYSSSADALRSDPTLLQAAYLEGISAALEHRGLAS